MTVFFAVNSFEPMVTFTLMSVVPLVVVDGVTVALEWSVSSLVALATVPVLELHS